MEYIQTHNFLYQITLGYNNIEPNHHQNDDNPVIKETRKRHKLFVLTRKNVKYCDHCRGHSDANTQLNKENTEMLS